MVTYKQMKRANQQFKSKWASVEEAIERNESLMSHSDKNSWLQRETFVLKELKVNRER